MVKSLPEPMITYSLKQKDHQDDCHHWGCWRLCSANHRAGYFSNLVCDWLSIVWAYSNQETENGPRAFSLMTFSFLCCQLDLLKLNSVKGSVESLCTIYPKTPAQLKWCMNTSWHRITFPIMGLFLREIHQSPSAFPSQSASVLELWCFLCYYPQLTKLLNSQIADNLRHHWTRWKRCIYVKEKI